MPKKKLLITAMSMNIGGAEKSLVNLLNLLDYGVYDVDLLLFQRKGAFLSQVPAQTNVISVPEIDALYGIEPRDPMPTARKAALKAWRYLATCATRIAERQFDRRRLLRWQRFYSPRIPRLEGHYDCAVSYSGGETFWYVVEKVEADVMTAYYHNDYSNIDIDVEGELRYLECADYVATISNICADSLKRIFPSQAGKVRIAQNPTCVSLTRRLGEERVCDGFEAGSGKLKIASVGRVEDSKGFDMAVRAASIVKREMGPCFEWLIVGDGSRREAVQALIEREGVDDVIRLVGSKLNPYPYMEGADLLAQTSRFEGKSVVVDEARVLGLPVLATNYSSARDQVRDDIDGLIVPMDPEGIARGIEALLRDPALLGRLGEGAATVDVAALEDIVSFTSLLGRPHEVKDQ